MPDMFFPYLKLGFQYIVEINCFDHILFVVILCSAYQLVERRKIAIIITAFTLGHTIKLILASLHFIIPNRYLIELFIPITILISSIINLIPDKNNARKEKMYFIYTFALLYGLIHGMGFSSSFTDLMGDASSFIFPLFSFNLGIEIGQFFIIFNYYLFLYLSYKLINLSYKRFSLIFSVFGFVVSIILIINCI